MIASATMHRCTICMWFLVLGWVGAASGCQTAITEDAPESVQLRSDEVIVDFADAPPITVAWILEDPDAVTQLDLQAPLVRARITSTAPAASLVSGVWTVEHAGAASRVALQPFTLEAGATHDVSLDLASHCDLGEQGAAPGAVWLSLLTDSSGQVFKEGEEDAASGWIHPGTESLRFWAGGEHVQIVANNSLTRAQVDGSLDDEALRTALYPQLSDEDFADLQAGEIVEVVQWTPPSDQEQGMLDALAEQMKGKGG